MPFSSVLGASSVVKPGVCTSTTRPTVPYEGQLIYETDTDRVAAYNGSAWVYGSFAGGLVLIKSQTIGTAVSSVTVSNVFSSSYDNYKIVLIGGVGSQVSYLKLTLGATSTGYYFGGFYTASNWGAGNTVGTAGSNVAAWDAGGVNTDLLQTNIDLFGPNLAKRTTFQAAFIDARTGGSYQDYAGFLNNNTQYTDFTLTVNAGTITGGTIYVYGYANS